MLNKRVCMACHRNHFFNKWGVDWTSEEHKVWDRGWVVCPHADKPDRTGLEIETRVHADPPFGCPFLTEHVVAGGSCGD